jgi:hypothetical protein
MADKHDLGCMHEQVDLPLGKHKGATSLTTTCSTSSTLLADSLLMRAAQCVRCVTCTAQLPSHTGLQASTVDEPATSYTAPQALQACNTMQADSLLMCATQCMRCVASTTILPTHCAAGISKLTC